MPVTTFSVGLETSEYSASVSQAEAAARRSQQQYVELVSSLEAIVWRADAATFEQLHTLAELAA